MKKSIFSSLLFTVSLSVVHGEIVTDSFDDNSTDVTIWAPQEVFKDDASSPELSFVEQNQRLELIAIAPVGSLTQTELYQESLIRLPGDSDWTATIRVNNSVDTGASPSVRIGMMIFDHSYTHSAGLLLKADDGGRRLQDSQRFDIVERFSQDPSLLEPYGTIRISFVCASQEIELAWANGANAPFDRVDNLVEFDPFDESSNPVSTAAWDSVATEGFLLNLHATSAGTSVSSGEAYLEDLTVIAGASPTISLSRVSGSKMSLSFTGILETNSALSGEWVALDPQPTSPLLFSPISGRAFFRSKLSLGN